MSLKILIIRFSSIGDIVLTSPVVRVLKQQLNAEVHFLTKKPFRSILDANPHVDKVYAIQSKPEEVAKELRNERYDWVIDLHHNLRSLQVKLLLRRPSRSFNKINFQKWVMVQLKLNVLPPQHIVERYLETVRHLGVQDDGQGLDYFIPEAQEVTLRQVEFPASFMPQWRSLLQQGQYLALVIGAAHATKRMPLEKLLELCQNITYPIVLLGGPEDRATGQQIVEHVGDHVLNTCGQYSLHQSASWLRQAQQVITHDTGLMHMAAALRKPIVTVWGNTIPAFGMSPYYPQGMNLNTNIELNSLPCRPCSKIGYSACPRGHFACMNQLEVQNIRAAIELPLIEKING